MRCLSVFLPQFLFKNRSSQLAILLRSHFAAEQIVGCTVHVHLFIIQV